MVRLFAAAAVLLVALLCRPALAEVTYAPPDWPEALRAKSMSTIRVDFPGGQAGTPVANVAYDVYQTITGSGPAEHSVVGRCTGTSRNSETVLGEETVAADQWRPWTVVASVRARAGMPDAGHWYFRQNGATTILRHALSVESGRVGAMELVVRRGLKMSDMFMQVALPGVRDFMRDWPKSVRTEGEYDIYRFDFAADLRSLASQVNISAASAWRATEMVFYVEGTAEAVVAGSPIHAVRYLSPAADPDGSGAVPLSSRVDGLAGGGSRLAIDQSALDCGPGFAVLRELRLSFPGAQPPDAGLKVSFVNGPGLAVGVGQAEAPAQGGLFAVLTQNKNLVTFAVYLAGGVLTAVVAAFVLKRVAWGRSPVAAALVLAGLAFAASVVQIREVAGILAFATLLSLLASGMAGVRTLDTVPAAPVNARVGLYLLVFLAVAAMGAWTAPFGTDADHAGQAYVPARIIAEGGVPFRDTNSWYGLVVQMMNALLVKVLGPKLVVFKASVGVFAGLSAVMLVALWSRLLPMPLALVTIGLWLALMPMLPGQSPVPWWTTYHLPLQLATILAVLAYRPGRTGLWLVLAGALVGAMTCNRLNAGLLNFAALMASVAVVAWAEPAGRLRVWLRASLWAGLGYGAAVAAGVGYLAWHHALDDWYRQTILAGRLYVATFGDKRNPLLVLLNDLLPLVDGFISVLLPASAAVIAASLAWARLRGGTLSKAWPQVLVLAVFGLASWVNYFPNPQFDHIVQYASLSFGLLALLVHRAVSRHVARPAMAVTVSAAILLALGSFDAWRCIKPLPAFAAANDTPVRVHPVLDGMLVARDQALAFEAFNEGMAAAARERPGVPAAYINVQALQRGFSPVPSWDKVLPLMGDMGIRAYPDYPARLGAYIAQRRPPVAAFGNPLEHLGYRLLQWHGDGTSILVPGPPDRLTRLPGAAGGGVSTHVTLGYSRLGSLQREGYRLPPVDLDQDFTLEFLVKPLALEQPEATVFSNRDIPERGQGLSISRHGGEYRLAVAGQNGATVPVLAFPLPAERYSHVALTRAGGHWAAWVDGRPVATGTFAGPVGGQGNAVVVGGHDDRHETVFSGYLPELRVMRGAAPEAEIARRGRELDGWANAMPLRAVSR